MIPIDVCQAADAIRNALESLGWKYIGGGPYPFTPKLHFQHPIGKEIFTVEIKPKEAK